MVNKLVLSKMTSKDIMDYGEQSVATIKSYSAELTKLIASQNVSEVSNKIDECLSELIGLKQGVEKKPWYRKMSNHIIKAYELAKKPSEKVQKIEGYVGERIKELQTNDETYETMYSGQKAVNELILKDIEDGKVAIENFQREVLPTLQEKIKKPTSLQEAKECEQLIEIADAFEKRMADLALSRHDGIISCERIQQAQKANRELTLSLRSVINIAVPKWHSAIGSIIMANNVKQAAKTNDVIIDFTRKLERTASEYTKQAVIEGTRASRRLLFGSEEIQYSLDNVIGTFQQVAEICNTSKTEYETILKEMANNERKLIGALTQSRRSMMESIALASGDKTPVLGESAEIIQNK